MTKFDFMLVRLAAVLLTVTLAISLADRWFGDPYSRGVASGRELAKLEAEILIQRTQP